MLWLGQIDGRWYSIVMPVTITDEAAYQQIAASNENVYYENKMSDLSKGLDHLTRSVLILFAIAYLVIVVVLKFFYSWKQTLKIASIPLLSVLVIFCGLTIAGESIEFFAITGIILVFGLGLDYIIYMIENSKRNSEGKDMSDFQKLEPFAIMLSFLTTAISFGALALSGFVPVHLIGLTIFLGLTGAFIGTLF